MKYILVLFFSLFFTRFFEATILSHVFFLTPLIPFIFLEIRNKSIYKNYFLVIIIGLIISWISCYYFRGQSISNSIIASANIFYISYYFMLKKINLSVSKMEDAIFVLTVLFCICYIIQYIVYPFAIFSGGVVEYEEDIRIRMAGQAFASLGYFFGLNKYFTKKNNNVFYLLLAILSFSIIFLMGFRTMIVGIIICSSLMIIKINGFSWKVIFYSLLLVLIFILSINIPVFAEIFNHMVERNQNAIFTNRDYIRILQFQYFTQEHFTNGWEYISGSGLPRIGLNPSTYGQQILDLYDKGIVWADWGLIGFSWMIGIITVIAMLGYALKAYVLKIPPSYYYLSIWFLYLILVSFTTKEFFRDGAFVVQAIALFIIEKVHSQFVNYKRKEE